MVNIPSVCVCVERQALDFWAFAIADAEICGHSSPRKREFIYAFLGIRAQRSLSVNESYLHHQRHWTRIYNDEAAKFRNKLKRETILHKFKRVLKSFLSFVF